MSGIYGIFHRDGRPVDRSTMEWMRPSMAFWGPKGCQIRLNGPAGLGRANSPSLPEAPCEDLPRVEASDGRVWTAIARLDNRSELDRLLQIPPSDRARGSDSDYLLRAYRQWGEDCPIHLHGDWSLAAWHPAERKLFLARDPFGQTALYYYSDPTLFAFASSRQALLDLSLAPIAMDELYLAQVLVSWPDYHGERTVHSPIRRLPPAHCLTVTPDRLDLRRYWRLEETPELRLPHRSDYVEAFREVFDEAVRSRLRPPGAPRLAGEPSASPSGVAATLSGGLDSGSVVVTAAGFLREEGRRLTAFTSVPLSDPAPYVGKRFADEYPYAQAVSRHAGNVDLYPIAAEGRTPLQAIRTKLSITYDPQHAAGNFYWMLDLFQAARDRGCGVVLTGQMGNAGISWTGDLFSQPWAAQIRRLGTREWALRSLKRAAPAFARTAWENRRRPSESDWCRLSAIHPEFARRLSLRERVEADPDPPPGDPLAMRYRILKPGRSLVGANYAEISAHFGVEVLDPTADARVLALTLSIPDRIFMDPETGIDRWLIRETMKGRLPDEVRLNRRRGRQAGDLVPRLRASAGEVEGALEEIESGPATAYLDVPYMRECWRLIQAEDTPEAFTLAITVLTRGIMAGLFVNGFP